MSLPSTLFVDHTAALGGAELYLKDILERLPGHHSAMLFENGALRNRLEQVGIPVVVAEAGTGVHAFARESGLAAALCAVPGAFKLIREVARRARDHEVVFANSQKAFVVAALAGLIARRPVIWNLHDLLTADHFSAFNTWLVVWLANTLARRVIVNSEATREAFIEAGGRRELTTVIYNGLDIDAFDSVDPTPIRHELGIGEVPLIGVFSRLAPWKGQHVLIDAIAGLPEVHALIVGEALFGEEVAYAQQLRQATIEKGLEHRIHFLGFRDDVPALMQAADVVAHTSTAPEPFGRVIVEGMLARTPVVATAAGGALEILEHGRTGWLVPPGDGRALQQTLTHMLSHAARTRRSTQAGYLEARSRFSTRQMLSAVSCVVHHVV